MSAEGQAGVGAVGIATSTPSLSPHAMSVKEAIKLADRWSAGWKEEQGGLAEVLSVLVDRIVVLESRLRESEKATKQAYDHIQALTLDLALFDKKL